LDEADAERVQGRVLQKLNDADVDGAGPGRGAAGGETGRHEQRQRDPGRQAAEAAGLARPPAAPSAPAPMRRVHINNSPLGQCLLLLLLSSSPPRRTDGRTVAASARLFRRDRKSVV